MKNENIETKLTPAANEALSELVENYKNEILLGAMRSATTSSGEIKEITVRDILSGLQKPEGKLSSSRKRKQDVAVRAGALVGIVYAVIGFGYFLFKSFDLRLDYEQQMGLAIGILGLFVASFSFWYMRKRTFEGQLALFTGRSYTQYTPEQSMLLIQKWRDIEIQMRNLAAIKLGESVADKPISLLLNELVRSGNLDKSDEQKIKALLNARNEVLHKGIVLSKEELENALDNAEQILKKITAG